MDNSDLNVVLEDLKRIEGELVDVRQRLQALRLVQAAAALDFVSRDVSIVQLYVENAIAPEDETPLATKRKNLNMRFLQNS